VEQLPFEDETFDSALSQFHAGLAGCGGWLREIRRVMKNGGRIALAFTRHSGQPKRRLTDALTAASFTDVRVTEMNDGFCALATKP
jgi:ubiquinone/menaquinone biosynthesis C-methylase UbiE